MFLTDDPNYSSFNNKELDLPEEDHKKLADFYKTLDKDLQVV